MRTTTILDEEKHACTLEKVFQIFMHAQEDWAREHHPEKSNIELENKVEASA